MRKSAPGVPKKCAWHPCDYEDADAYAIQAVALGTASEEQQRRAMAFVINQVCLTYDMSFRPDSARETDFAEGKRFVGLQLVKLIKMNLSALRGKNTEQGEAPKPKEQ